MVGSTILQFAGLSKFFNNPSCKVLLVGFEVCDGSHRDFQILFFKLLLFQKFLFRSLLLFSFESI